MTTQPPQQPAPELAPVDQLVSALEKAVRNAHSAAMNAVGHVGAANYADREREAREQLRARLQGVLFPLLGKFGWQIPAYRTEADSRTAAEMCHRSGVPERADASQQECISAPWVQQAMTICPKCSAAYSGCPRCGGAGVLAVPPTERGTAAHQPKEGDQS